MSTKFSELHVRQKSYTEFYSRFIEDHFNTNQDFIDSVKNVLDSGNFVLGAFKRGDNLGIHQCAYLLQFGVHDACLGEEILGKSAVECQKLQELCSKERINICCLGSQGLLTVLGVCKVIEEYGQKFKFSDAGRTRVQIFIVDKNKTWKVLSEYIMNAAKKKYPSLKLKLDFLTTDMSKNYKEMVSTRIQISHIVTMVKYLSSLTLEDTTANITKNTFKDMKKNALLLYWDHDTRGDVDQLRKMMVETKSFREIKCSESPEKHTLHEETKLHHQKMYEFLSPVNTYWNPSTAPVTYSTWINNPEVKIKCVDEKQGTPVKSVRPAVGRDPEDPVEFYQAKRSSNTKRNSTEKFRLVGKFALKDMEKKNKDDSKRQKAKEAAASRYADFDDW